MDFSYVENRKIYDEKQWTFHDGIRTIDFVLAWGDPHVFEMFEDFFNLTSPRAAEQRKVYEENLREEGLELEHELVEETGLHFVKIYCPLDILKFYAEFLELRCPIKPSISLRTKRRFQSTVIRTSQILLKKYKPSKLDILRRMFEIPPDVFPDFSEELTETYRRSKEYLFDVDSPGFFTPSQKARIVEYILERTPYIRDDSKEGDAFDFGINRLILSGVYDAAYPLHDGDLDTPGTMRNRFYKFWASCSNFYKKQPADQLMQYFGVKNAFFFIWLEHYTLWLIVPSIIGLVSIVILIFFILPDSKLVHDMCGGVITEPMCPLCDHTCDFWKLSDFCWEARLLSIFDSENAVIFAIVMAIWTTVHVETWRRKSADIALRWDLTNFDIMDETPRPEYAARLSKYANRGGVEHQINLITNVKEPKIDYWKHVFPEKMLSLSAMLLLVSMQLTVVIAVIMYNTIALAALNSGLIATVITAILNLISILIFSPMYRKLSLYLTQMEWHRTQPEFEQALVIKLYLLEFLNNYSSLFYVAFVKAKLSGPPNNYNRIFGYREDPCTIDSCMLELTGQLAVIMIGQRVLTSFNKILLPFATEKYRRLRSFAGLREYKKLSQYEKDFFLEEPKNVSRYLDKLDMAIQYGFVTIFVSAFPLAPLFALINNILEVRILAQKLLIYNRRTPMWRCRDIGVWMNILEYISTFSVFTNGFILAFTSNFIPRMVYRMFKSPNSRSGGYLNFSLSYVAIEDLDSHVASINAINATYCRFSAFREPPWSENKYEHSDAFWVVFACRCTFFILFENLIMLLMFIIKWAIPAVPQHVKWKTRRNRCMLKEIAISYESSQKNNFSSDRQSLIRVHSAKNTGTG